MDLWEIRSLLEYWKEHPPTHEVVLSAYFNPKGVEASRGPYEDSNRIRPRKMEDFMSIPNLAPSNKPARPLMRFPIQVPGDNYWDKTPKFMDAKCRI